MEHRLKQAGFEEGDNFVLMNTCAVTKEACNEAIRQARRLKRENSRRPVIITGCGAQIDTEVYEKSPYVDLIIANSHKNQLPEILNDFQNNKLKSKVFKSNIFKTDSDYQGYFEKSTTRTRVFLKIQDGCSSFCSFCIIPFARGKSRSLPINQLVSSVQKFVDDGVEELVLTGVHIGDYKDGDQSLEDLVESILVKTHIKRLRLTSLEPLEFSPKMWDLYKDPRLCPHFHLSIQSASTKVLQAMRRNYLRKDVENIFSEIHKRLPHAFVGMDVIAGFTAETEEDFQETYEVLHNSPWTKIHVFPYSPRRKSSTPPHPRCLIKKRASQLRHLSASRFESLLSQQVGSQKQVLCFENSNELGLSRDYWKIKLPIHNEKGEKWVKIQGFDLKNSLLQASFI